MEEPSRSKISGFVVCCNEEPNIERCLTSLAWCDEIIVIDSGSSDRTLEICQRFAYKIVQQPWLGYAKQKQLALSHCTHEWVISIDADEEVSPELRAEILTILKNPALGPVGYELPRVVYFLGKWWRRGGWHPEYRLRCCRRSLMRFGGVEPHDHAHVQGPTMRLQGELRHYTYTDFASQIRSINNLTSVSAQSLFERGRRASLVNIFLNPLARFVKFYFIRRGFLEGFSGLLVAIIESFSVFLKYCKLWELGRNQS